ncbi:hypothetical protein SPRG_02432 [Saprolegnia parasitica CBS 223.65]|uniref:AN1-type domain-containing protein n=1 Tax=Saprolegnia parasitica (strain CBS 223.65) TaxID=695850 RepID=A0A067CPY8_SAPPC|nr:hypothetical protein SPRG_02432 [Saprolegnia parasitica CBS 223.65]KDO32734.1 hypothetical protein SPRG_02432 [Saprolegnia parasitica CBS 223.65]|eukprot:XP_012196398.1 hypothetical protein SPRG_02432 [Saprolegnia parasitica CBS 223.65]
MDVGEHCSNPGCNQKDFLPFACDCCNGIFCLEHRTYDAHACAHAGAKDARAITCPLCRATIPLTGAMDVDEYEEKKKPKERCAADSCREVLTASNTVQCNSCRKKVCLRHRFETDHQCPRRATPPARPASMQQRMGSSVSRLVQSAKTAAAAPSKTNVTAASESCPMCKETFRYTSQLIAHVNKAHPDSGRARPSAAPAARASAVPVASSGQETCPVCRTTFAGVTQLIAHAESAHQGQTQQGKGDCSMM